MRITRELKKSYERMGISLSK